MQSITLQKRNEQRESIKEAVGSLKNVNIDDQEKINSTIAELKERGISSFAIREALKETGLLDF